ncbi:hypothetical protein GCM10010428_14000 [Actinosynnema pretiosum subsp. pretiosum]
MRRVSTRVFPDPAPATTRRGEPACSTALRCAGLSPSSSDAEPEEGGLEGKSNKALIVDPRYRLPASHPGPAPLWHDGVVLAAAFSFYYGTRTPAPVDR